MSKPKRKPRLEVFTAQDPQTFKAAMGLAESLSSVDAFSAVLRVHIFIERNLIWAIRRRCHDSPALTKGRHLSYGEMLRWAEALSLVTIKSHLEGLERLSTLRNKLAHGKTNTVDDEDVSYIEKVIDPDVLERWDAQREKFASTADPKSVVARFRSVGAHLYAVSVAARYMAVKLTNLDVLGLERFRALPEQKREELVSAWKAEAEKDLSTE